MTQAAAAAAYAECSLRGGLAVILLLTNQHPEVVEVSVLNGLEKSSRTRRSRPIKKRIPGSESLPLRFPLRMQLHWVFLRSLSPNRGQT